MDRQFRKFQATGDPEALGKVFDAVAPKLLLAATHLARRGDEAEDLVQATFLRAIEHAKSFDAGRRLMPWLIGILTNEARMARRRTRRMLDPDKVAPPRPAIGDPQVVAEANEFGDALARALDALPRRYRLVLTLKVVHGLSPLEIAHAMELPPETVKSRIRRGLQMLRRDLPAGHVVGLATVALPSTGLGAARAAVLSHVPSVSTTAAAPVGAALLFGMVMKKVTIAGLGVLCVGALGLGMWGVFDDPPHAGDAVREEAASARTNLTDAVRRSRGTERRSLATSVSMARSDWRLEGRVLDAHEQPIPGARIELTAERSGVGGGVAGSSQATGRYFVDLSPWQKRSRFENDHVTLKASVWAPGFHVAAADISLGHAIQKSTELSALVLKQDFKLHKGSVLTGRVVDSRGDPVPEVYVTLHVGNGRSSTRTSSRGRYQINVLEAGQGYILAQQEGVGVGILRDLRLATDQDQTMPDLSLSALGVIRGVLMYDDGQPIAGSEVWFRAMAPDKHEAAGDPRSVLEGLTQGSARTGKDGSFAIRGLKPGRYRFTPWVLLGSQSGEDPSYEIETGQPPIEIRLAYQRLRMRVFDPEGKRVLHAGCSYLGWRPDKDALVRRMAAGEPVFDELDGDVMGGGQIDDQMVPRGSWVLISTGAQGYDAHRLVLANGPTHETVVDLHLAKGLQDARLRLTVLSSGKPISFSIRLKQTRPGFPAREEEIESVGGTKVYRCNAGTFLAEIQPAPTGEFRSPSSYMKIHRLVRLQSQQETELQVQAERGGRVALLVHTPEGWKGSDRRPVQATVPAALGKKPRSLGPYMYERVFGKEKHYMGSGSGPVNKRVTCRGLLAPRKHVITVKTKGFRPKKVAVEVFAGKVTDVEVWLTGADVLTNKEP